MACDRAADQWSCKLLISLSNARNVCCVAAFLFTCLVLPSTAASDPVTDFIVTADSLATAGGDDALSPYVRENGILVGAVVAQLLDVAFDVTEQGNAEGAAENVAFAKRVARLHQNLNGSAIPIQLVMAYERWTPEDRMIRLEAKKLEEDATAARGAGELDKAVELLNAARAKYEMIGDLHSIAVNYGSLGVVHWYRGDMAAVGEHYEKALEARRGVEDRILEGRTLNGIGSANRQVGALAEAKDWYKKAIDLRRKTKDLSGLGTSLTYLGNVYYVEGRLADARDWFEEALPILEAQGNAQQMFEILNSIAGLYVDMGRAEESNDTYRRAIEFARSANRLDYESIARRNLADNFRTTGRYQDALDELANAENVISQMPQDDATVVQERVELLRVRGITYMAMGELEKSREDFLACIQVAKEFENPGHHMDALINIGHLYYELGAFERGLKSGVNARALAEGAGDARRYRAALILAGDCNFRLQQYDAAVEMYNLALEQDEYDQLIPYVLQDKAGIASIYAASGKTAEAREILYQALPEALAAGRDEVALAMRFALGHSYESENPDSSVAHYNAALDQIEAVGSGIGGAEVQTGFLSGKRRYYYEEIARFYARLFADTGDDKWSSIAHRTMERAKARGLVGLMEQSLSGQTSEAEADALDALYSLDSSAPGYADQKRELEARYVKLRGERINTSTGGLSSDLAVADLAAVQKALPKKTVMLEYAVGDTTSLLWAIDRKSSRLMQIPQRVVLEESVRRFRDALARPGAGDEALRKASRDLYKSLVAPAEEFLEGAERLVIVPDGILFELPFDALLTRDAEGDDWGAQPFLARSYASVYAPSATVYVALKSADRSNKYELDLVAIGNPDFSGLSGEPLEPLGFATQEVEAISADMKDNKKVVLTGGAANEGAVKERLGDTSPRVLHLATHGLVNPAEPGRSSIALAASGNEDGYLYTLEILSLSCNPGLVVMSACESARGKLSRGEGVVGLSRAFIATGAGAVVASLWAVSDESTAALMREFYGKMLGKKRTADRALHEARLALIDSDRFAHPFYWSPFIVTGTEQSPW